ncbi:MAG: sigma-70 family RNA polymerase sigma factor [Planctomycetota bacterium]|jgi:RNA polymerase sigma-70 factor (ECF subfamily)|nr:hypothetical protein [Planctomycetota bacterium]MDP6408550.1 sigma-70 family RNA polymerase sigma factor [Planctomycetota bacterium]MDP6762255.1 sigma-70 family RNA polymerase sigma factor [Planctomycetota bacterium]
MHDNAPDAAPPPPAESRSSFLLRAYQAGDSEALDRLLSRVHPRVERIARARLGHTLRGKVDALDVTQEALLRASQHLADFEEREDASLIDWLAKIVENEVLRQAEHFAAQKRDLRREERLDRYADPHWDSELPDELADETAGPHTRVSRGEMARLVDECLAELREEHREVILLRDYAGGSWSFVADSLGRPSADAAMQLYRRARIELADKVRRRT